MINLLKKMPNQTGRSMIEMLGVLGIIGVLSVGGISGYSKAMTNYKVNKSVDQISIIISNIKNIGMRQRSYEGLSVSSAIKFHAIPDNMIKNNKLVNPFGGNVYIGTNQNDTSPYRGFYVAYTDLPKEACINIINKDWSGKKTSIIAYNQKLSESTLQSIAPATSDSCTKSSYTICNNIKFPISKLTTACNCSTDTCSIAIYSFR